MGMMMVQKIGGKAVKVFSDSKLVVSQVMGDLKARDPRMQEYLCQIKSVQEKFEVFLGKWMNIFQEKKKQERHFPRKEETRERTKYYLVK